MLKHTRLGAAVALAALAVVALGSCGDDSDKNTICVGDESDIVDLTEGTMWIYRGTDYDTLDNVIRTFEDTILIVRDTIIDEETWFLTSIENELWGNRDDGYWIWENFDGISEPYLRIKYPTALGDHYPIPIEEVFSDTMTTADLIAVTTVPYGTFTAITYRRTSYEDSLISLGYYVRGIGKVREIIIPDRETRFIRRTLELLKFTSAGC